MSNVWLLGLLCTQSPHTLWQFSETIVLRVLRVLHVLLRHLPSAKRKGFWEGQRPRCPIRRRTGNEDVAPPVRLNPARSSVKWGWALRVVERRPLFCDSVVKDQISACRTCISASHFQSAKHIFKASVACNGREVLRGTPVGRVPENTSLPALCGASPWGGFPETK